MRCVRVFDHNRVTIIIDRDRDLHRVPGVVQALVSTQFNARRLDTGR